MIIIDKELKRSSDIRTETKKVVLEKLQTGTLNELDCEYVGNTPYVAVQVNDTVVWVSIKLTTHQWEDNGKRQAFDIAQAQRDYEEEQAIKEQNRQAREEKKRTKMHAAATVGATVGAA